MKKTVYGLDFGTTNSTIMIFNNGRVTDVPIADSHDNIMRSVIFFPDDSIVHFIGEEAISQYIESNMKGRLIQSIKSFLPDSHFTKTYIRDGWYTLEELIALIIREIKAEADAITGKDIKSVVLGRPAVFSRDHDDEELAKGRLIEAARLAGFEEVHFQIEPIAAALTYEQTLSGDELVLVADLGGGTSDFTLMKLSPENAHKTNRYSDILATNGVYIGGDKFDSSIMWHKLVKYFGQNIKWHSWDKWLDMPAHLMRMICEWRKIPFLKKPEKQDIITKLLYSADEKEPIRRLQALIDENLGFSLFQSIEEAKCNLSEFESTEIFFKRSLIDICEPILRSEFEEMIEKEIDTLENCLRELLESGGVKTSEVNSVFITGGTSQVPAIIGLLEKWFGEEKIKSGETFTSVAKGLALSAPLFYG